MSTATLPRSPYTYAGALAAAEKIHWRVEDLIGGDKRLDFSKPFLAESLARVRPLEFLSPEERIRLNQIRGHEYLSIFGLAEEFILPFVVDTARPALGGEDHQVRALLEFAAEEAKHIHLFRRFREEFRAGFGSECGVIGPPAEVAKAVLAQDPLSVALVILQIEWMTQRHFEDSVRDDESLDPRFKSLLRHHWMEEAQHARLDTLMVEALAEGRSRAEIDAAVDGYLQIGAFLDEGFGTQVELNLAAFERATGRGFTEGERARFREVQRGALRWAYLGSGMTHPKFAETLERLGVAGRIAAVAPAFS
jgi:hypothetical protein